MLITMVYANMRVLKTLFISQYGMCSGLSSVRYQQIVSLQLSQAVSLSSYILEALNSVPSLLKRDDLREIETVLAVSQPPDVDYI